MKAKKLLTVCLAVACVSSALAGCGNSEQQKESAVVSTTVTKSAEASETSSQTVSEEFDPKTITDGVKLTVAIQENVKVEDYDTNKTTLAIEEALGVDLEFVTFPAADYESKLNVMVQSGETLPDIICLPGANHTSWAAEGAIISLNEFYEDPNLSANLRIASENIGKDIAYYMQDADGNIWGIPQYGESLGGQVAQKMWIYKPWLDAIGEEVPTTPEEFYEVCKKLADTDLNGNGKADELLISGCNTAGGQTWINYLMTPFVYAHDSNYLVVEDGQLSFAYTSEGWKEGLKYIRRFFEEGLFTTEILTQDGSQYWAQVYSEEPSVFSFVYYHYANDQLENKVNYTCIPALENEDGVAQAYYSYGKPSTTNVGAVISADCENPEAAFLVCDYLCNREVSISQRYGERGVNWDYWEDAKVDNKEDYEAAFPGYEISLYLYDNDGFWASTEAQNISYLQKCPYIFDVNIPAGIATLKVDAAETEADQLKAETSKIVNTAIMECFEYIPEEYVDIMPLTADETAEISDVKATLTSYVKECLAAFITGTKDIDAEWDAYLAELEKIGYKELLEVYQEAYDRVH